MANVKFGNILRSLRNRRGFTQQQVADLLGLKNKSTLGSWEVGKSEPDGYTFLKLCRLYQVENIYETFNSDGILESVEINDFGEPLDSKEKEVLLAYRNADPITKELVHRALNVSSTSAGVESAQKDVS